MPTTGRGSGLPTEPGEKVFTALLAQADIEGDVASIGAVDSTVVRAHQHAAEARPKGIPPASLTTTPSNGVPRAG
ncbi:hypothetical protein OG285_31965 [Streptomyces sp. NBC_01471]|uniref:hypothetical protein n=1 Tax=Streptomyces sp. NBC_01471 TaxID=2903879 RepID=UPI00324DBA88